MKELVVFVVSVFLFAGCGGNGAEKTKTLVGPLFELVSAIESGVHFSNDLKEDDFQNTFLYEYFYNGGGVSLGDINNDGLTDIYFTGNMTEDKLYLNKGDFKFEDITSSAITSGQEGWHNGTTMVDINADGLLDIYVCRAGNETYNSDRSNLLYVNNGDLTFTERAQEYGLADTLLSTQASFFDYDLDGDLDVYVMNIPQDFFAMSQEEMIEMYRGHLNESDHFYRNDNGKFVDVSYETRINNHAFGLGLSVGDLNNDGYPDVYISNDYEVRDYLLMNKNGIFQEELMQQINHISNFGMGTDIGDFNNDGEQDIVELDMAYATHERSKRNMESMSSEKFWGNVSRGNHYQYMLNTLQLNNGNSNFSEIGQLAGISKTDWSWGALFADFDMDGWSDLIITNGIRNDLKDKDFQAKLQRKIENQKLRATEVLSFTPSYKVSNYIYQNNGDLTFKDRTSDWGLKKEINSHGVAYADLDNDGDLDLVVNNLDDKASIYRNRTDGSKNYISIELKGNKSNKFAIGTRISVYSEGNKQVKELFLTRGYLSSMEPKLNFGLGTIKKIDRIEIRWPNLRVTVLEDVEVNQNLVLDYSDVSFGSAVDNVDAPFFSEIQIDRAIDYIHKENPFNDFERELLLPHTLSTQGPCMAIADVNGDGTDDLYIGGSKSHSGQLFYQVAGRFQAGISTSFASDRSSEDLGALFFDADGDDDLDLYVASGGNEFSESDGALQDRLYINDGTGNFSKKVAALPRMISSSKVVKSGDFDGDGDLDLFVGGRLIPGKYPLTPNSYLLENNGNGIFTDVTAKWCSELSTPGMVTGAEFADINNDGKLDLTLVGEWMGFTRYINTGTSFTQQIILTETEGMWFSLAASDIDNDGDVDFIAGNLGINAKFKASKDKPFNIYGHDFDENGSLDIVLSTYEGETNYPVRGRECTSEQMPFISDKFRTYESFAKADINSLYGDNIQAAKHLTIRTLYSSVFINDGNGNFKMKQLPNLAQVSPLMGLIIEDINGDGYLDILGAGNKYGAEVETVRYDAGIGVYLLGDGKGNFNPTPALKSGFYATGNVKSLLGFQLGTMRAYLVGRNSDKLKLFLKRSSH